MSLLFKSYFDVLFRVSPGKQPTALQLPAPRVTGLLLLWSLLFYRNLLFTQFNDRFVLVPVYAKWNADDTQRAEGPSGRKDWFAIETYLAFEAWPEAGHFHFGALGVMMLLAMVVLIFTSERSGLLILSLPVSLPTALKSLKPFILLFCTDSTPAPLSEGYRGCMSAPSLPPSV